MRTKSYNTFVLLSIGFLILSLSFFTVTKITKIKSSHSVNTVFSNNSINLTKLSPIEKEILNNFEKIPPNQYSIRYKEIAENNRPLLDLHSEENIGAHILKELLNSQKLSQEQRLYILNKLRILDPLSGNIVNTIKITIEYLDLAERLNSHYDIARAKIGLSSIINSLGGHHTAIDLLNNLNLKNENFPQINRVKISKYLHLAENYFFIEEYNKAFKALDNLPSLLASEPEDYKTNILLLKNLISTQIFLKNNSSEEAFKALELSKYLFKNLQKIYFSDLEFFYTLTLEKYNLKYDFKKFNVNKIRNFVDTYQKTGDIIFFKMAFDLLFQYYFETNNLIEYRNLDLTYASYLNKINDANNKFFTLYLVENLEHERSTLENNKLYKHIFILLFSIFIILIVSYRRVQYLDKKTKIDALTKIGNRLAFNTTLKTIKNKSYYMLLFDIDNFKKLNDSYRHDFGDEVLSTVGKILKTIENKEISIYRIGGEEFSIIFTNLNKNFCIDSCEYIRKSIENIKWKYPITVTISGGFSKSNTNTFVECDLRLYEAKKSGKNMIIYQDFKK